MFQGLKQNWITPYLVVLGLLLAVGAAQAQDPEVLVQPQGLAHAGVYPLRDLDPSLDGAGVRFAVIARSLTYTADRVPQNDYLPFQSHVCFRDTTFDTLDNGLMTPDVSDHATAICSILFGYDLQAAHPAFGTFMYEGVVPAAGVQVYELDRFLRDHVFKFLSTGILSAAELDADVISLSCGNAAESWWTRSLEKIVNTTGATVVGSIGNGSDADQPLLYPGAAANLIGVGVVASVRSQDPLIQAAHFGLAYPEHSSCGPAADGRCKPDLVAPGNCLVADTEEVDKYHLPGDWSSFAAPVVAGVAGQLIQKARQERALNLAAAPEAGGRVIKAVLMNSATKLPHWHKGRIAKDDDVQVPLDYAQGAGLVNAVGAYEQLVAGRQRPGAVKTQGWDLNRLNELDGSTSAVYRFKVTDPGQTKITCTAVWNRRYGDPLDLESLAETNFRLELYAVKPADRSLDKHIATSDSTVDNVEHIHCDVEPGYRFYELVIKLHPSTSRLPEQMEKYALAWRVGTKSGVRSILPEDLNSDGIVNDLDLASLAAYREAELAPASTYTIGDVNTDGVIDDEDAAKIEKERDTRADWNRVSD